MRCPFCLSDNLREFEEDTISDATTITSQCCEDCGGSFAMIQEPQDILLEERLKSVVEGVLINGPFGVQLRVYDEDKEHFVDYRIKHSDMSIIVVDEDTNFVKFDSQNGYVDHSNETLGIKETNEKNT